MAVHVAIKEDALYQIGQEGGLQKCKHEEKEKTALHMLREGFPEEVVVRITRLPAERVTQLKQGLEAGQ